MTTVTAGKRERGESTPATTDRKLRIAILVLSLIGVAIAGYLTYIHYHGLGSLLCLGKSNGHSSCQTVQSSVYAKLDGVPVALLGLLGYIGILGSLILPDEPQRISGFAIALIGFGFSAYLTYRELFTIKAICEWCVSSAVIMTVLAVLTAIRVLREAPSPA